jgi:hypothetical protein
MASNIDFRVKLYKPIRTTLSWFVVFAFGMSVYAYVYEIGSLSQVIQAVALGVVALVFRLKAFKEPNITPAKPRERETDGKP